MLEQRYKGNRKVRRFHLFLTSGTIAAMPGKKNSAAVSLGRLRIQKMTDQEHKEMSARGGEIGGAARAQALSPEERSAIAKKAAAARWGKAKPATKRGKGK